MIMMTPKAQGGQGKGPQAHKEEKKREKEGKVQRKVIRLFLCLYERNISNHNCMLYVHSLYGSHMNEYSVYYVPFRL